jgi:hypothetical protein
MQSGGEQPEDHSPISNPFLPKSDLRRSPSSQKSLAPTYATYTSPAGAETDLKIFDLESLPSDRESESGKPKSSDSESVQFRRQRSSVSESNSSSSAPTTSVSRNLPGFRSDMPNMVSKFRGRLREDPEEYIQEVEMMASTRQDDSRILASLVLFR